eukprot:TRINITY_DN14039_c0_g1_i1.p1 TRINITY_DN14039_c0_g1~~TRINITY_DN14039_c0_g1_i1.p1  ORF type:complete len:102 (-),score=25.52 TRINITY_DN14039_c0_g1_i1:52-357(-)
MAGSRTRNEETLGYTLVFLLEFGFTGIIPFLLQYFNIPQINFISNFFLRMVVYWFIASFFLLLMFVSLLLLLLLAIKIMSLLKKKKSSKKNEGIDEKQKDE